MASIATLLSLAVATCVCVGGAIGNEFVQVHCKPATTEFGRQALLDCVIQTSKEVSHATIKYFIWKKKGDEEPLLKFNEGKITHSKDYKLAETSWDDSNMNVSLLITSVRVEHEGEYICSVFTDSGISHQKTKLSITARYNKPTVTSEKIENEHTLTCTTDGGYPKGQLMWRDENKSDWTTSSKFQAEQTEDGRFRLTSTLPLKPGSTFRQYTCMVVNATGGKEEEQMIDLKPIDMNPLTGEQAKHSHWVAPVVVIGSLIVGLLLLLFFRRRSQRARRQSTSTLIGDKNAYAEAPADIEKGDRK